jgi:hypothetical protein
MRYEKPELIDLSQEKTGLGFDPCNNGSSATGDCISNGNSPVQDCINGIIVSIVVKYED